VRQFDARGGDIILHVQFTIWKHLQLRNHVQQFCLCTTKKKIIKCCKIYFTHDRTYITRSKKRADTDTFYVSRSQNCKFFWWMRLTRLSSTRPTMTTGHLSSPAGSGYCSRNRRPSRHEGARRCVSDGPTKYTAPRKIRTSFSTD
jgi:hypothetical protein